MSCPDPPLPDELSPAELVAAIERDALGRYEPFRQVRQILPDEITDGELRVAATLTAGYWSAALSSPEAATITREDYWQTFVAFARDICAIK